MDIVRYLSVSNKLVRDIGVICEAQLSYNSTVMARNTSYKYWTNPIYRVYNPKEYNSFLRP